MLRRYRELLSIVLLCNNQLVLPYSFKYRGIIYLFMHFRSDEDIGPLSPLAVSLAAGFSGSIAAAASHSFDTAKSRSQCVVLPKYVSMERKTLKWTRPGKRFERLTGIHQSDRNVLFRGIWLRMARCGIASFALVGSYYWTVEHLLK